MVMVMVVNSRIASPPASSLSYRQRSLFSTTLPFQVNRSGRFDDHSDSLTDQSVHDVVAYRHIYHLSLFCKARSQCP